MVRTVQLLHVERDHVRPYEAVTREFDNTDDLKRGGGVSLRAEQTNRPAEVRVGQIWRNSNGSDYEVVSVIEGNLYKLSGPHDGLCSASEPLDGP